MRSGHLFLTPVSADEGGSVAAAAVSPADGGLALAKSSLDLPDDLAVLSTRALRAMGNDLYRVIDTDYPPYGALEDHARVIDELELRETQAAATRGAGVGPRGKFRDNPLQSRFELYQDGILIGHLSYVIRAGQITLLKTIIDEFHRTASVESFLIREALLNVHRRRLAPVLFCPRTRAFYAANPQYLTLHPTL